MTTGRRDRTAAIVAGAAGWVLAALGQREWAALVVLAGVGVAVVPTDLRHRRIPTAAVVVGALATVAATGLTALSDRTWSSIFAATIGAVVVGGAFLLVHLVHPAGLGFGDVRLAGLIGALIAYGTSSVATAVFVAAAAAVLAAVATVATRAGSAPFAPYLLATAVVAVALSIAR
jgi:leader peptidase (prepilin peptidase)/N-methyltransferase